MTLRLGVARADISPAWPVQLAGFGSRAGALIDRVAHPILARIAVLDDGASRIGIVSGELLNWSTESDARFREAVSAASGTPPENLSFVATHTHSAPQVSHLHAPTLGVVDERYLDLLEERLVAAAHEAARELREVTISRGAGRSGIARQRRAEEDLSVSPDPVRVDDEVTVVSFDDAADGRPRAVLLEYACHPVVSAENAVSGDFLGVAVATLEAQTGAVVLPLQGCAGDVNPADGPYEGLERAAALGERFAAEARVALDGRRPDAAPPALRSRWSSVELPFASVPTAPTLRELASHPGLEGEWATALLRHPELVRDGATCRLQLLELSDDLSLLLMSGEVTTEYGLHIKDVTRGRTVPVAYSNGMVGYIPTARQIRAGGYEVHDAARCYLLAGPFRPEIEERMIGGIDALLAS